jgi:hypothetical protein
MNIENMPTAILIDEDLDEEIECKTGHCMLCIILGYLVLVAIILFLKFLFDI